jgi:4-carboxymuconolactone decarboxylase
MSLSDSPGDGRYEKALAAYESVFGRRFSPSTAPGQPAAMADLWQVLIGHCFGDAWSRPGLEMRTRSFITLAMLIGLGSTGDEFQTHIKGAINLGVTQEEIVELLIHAAAYCGVPRTGAACRSALQVLSETPRET